MSEKQGCSTSDLDTMRGFARVFEAAQIGVTRVNSRGEVLAANPAFLEMTGYTLQELRALGWRNITVAGSESVEQAVLEYLASGKVVPPFEKRYLKKDGSQLPVLVNGVRPDPHVDEHIVFVVDLTQQKRVENDLRRSQDAYGALYAASPHPAWVFDLDSLRFLDVNPAAIALYGYSAEEFLAMSLPQIRPADEVPRLLEHHERVLRGENVGGTFHHLKKNGEDVWVDTRVQVLAAGFQGRRAALVQLTDITERIVAENALKTRTAELESLLTSAPIGFAFFDRQHRYVRVNEELARLNGIRAADHLGRTIADVIPANALIVEPIIDRVFATGEVIKNLEVQGETPAQPGATRYWLTGFYPVYGTDNAVQNVGVWVIEITERRHDEKALQRYAEELQLAAKRKDQFLATLAHELRNPMAPMRNAVAVIERMPQVDPMVSKMTQMIERQVKHMARLVDDLLDISRVTQGKITLHKTRFDLATIVHNALELVRPVMEAKQHTLQINVPPEPVFIEADPTRVAQIMGNLLDNAAKFTEPQGRIFLELEADSDRVLIRVRDNGVGMSTELVPQVFDVFVQGDGSLDRSQGGLGIGLSLVKNLVELHGGDVSASSAGRGYGSEFVVRLPRVR